MKHIFRTVMIVIYTALQAVLLVLGGIRLLENIRDSYPNFLPPDFVTLLSPGIYILVLIYTVYPFLPSFPRINKNW